MSGPRNFGPTIRAEWIKLRTVRSTFLIVVLAVGFGLAVGALGASSIARHWATTRSADRAALDPVGSTLDGFQYAALGFGALGVLAISTEYVTGMIRATFTATPRRLVAYASKVMVFFAFLLVVCEVSAFAAFFIGQHWLSTTGLSVGLGDPGVVRAIVCAGLYMATVGMTGLGLGAILRHTGGAMAAMFAVVFLAWPVARALEGFSYLPDRLLLANAADSLATIRSVTGPDAQRVPSLGFALFDLVLYLVVFLGIGAWRATRDA